MLRYIVALMLFILGVYVFRSPPGKIIPYLRKRAKSPSEFTSGLKIAMAVRRAIGVIVIALAILLVMQR